MSAHGGLGDDELQRLDARPGDVLDLSVNVNPYGPCPSVRRAIAEAPVDRYPDPAATLAKRALASRIDVDPRRVVVTNGAVDFLWLLARAALGPGRRALVVEPAFSELRRAAIATGATVVEHRVGLETGIAAGLDLAALDEDVRAVHPNLVYLCSPSNPYGTCTPLREIRALAIRHPETLFVVDVSFLTLSTRSDDEPALASDAVVWVRSLTKDHALAGLRVGYGVATRALAERLDDLRPPWSVNALAQAAAIATTTDEAARFVAESRTRWLDDRVALEGALARLGLPRHPSDTVYLLANVAPHRAANVRETLLLNHLVAVRDAASFGLPHHLRIAAPRKEELERLVHAFTTWQKTSKSLAFISPG